MIHHKKNYVNRRKTDKLRNSMIHTDKQNYKDRGPYHVPCIVYDSL